MPSWICLRLETKDIGGKKELLKKTNKKKTTSRSKRKEKRRWDFKKAKKISEKGKTNVNVQNSWTVSRATVKFLHDFRDWQTADYEQHPPLFPQRFLGKPSSVTVTSCLKNNSRARSTRHRVVSSLVGPLLQQIQFTLLFFSFLSKIQAGSLS